MPKSISLRILIRKLQEFGFDGPYSGGRHLFMSKDAFQEAFRSARKRDCILITGSFFLAGEARQIWFPEEKILKNRKSF